MKTLQIDFSLMAVLTLNQTAIAQYHDHEPTEELLTRRGVDWSSVRASKDGKELHVGIGWASRSSECLDLTRIIDIPITGLYLE